MSEAGEKSEGGYRGIDVQTGGEGYGCQEGEKLGERDLKEVEHGAVGSVPSGRIALCFHKAS